MIAKNFLRLAACAGFLITSISVPLEAQILLDDNFTTFELGTVWQAHGAAVPDVSLGIAGVGEDGGSLRLGSSPGLAGETVGIETMTPISLLGIPVLRVEARLRPLNQTGSGQGGGSDASIGVAIIGSTGAFTKASAGANRSEAPDWGNFYRDSEGTQDVASPAFLHFPPNDPNGGAEAFRTFALEISAAGTRLTTLASDGSPLLDTAFNIFNPNLTLDDFGDSATIALFQMRSDESHSGDFAPENVFGDLDHVVARVVPEPGSFTLTLFGSLFLLTRRRQTASRR
jgi:hypothetical protein